LKTLARIRPISSSTPEGYDRHLLPDACEVRLPAVGAAGQFQVLTTYSTIDGYTNLPRNIYVCLAHPHKRKSAAGSIAGYRWSG
jgi:hypothetical protein